MSKGETGLACAWEPPFELTPRVDVKTSDVVEGEREAGEEVVLEPVVVTEWDVLADDCGRRVSFIEVS